MSIIEVIILSIIQGITEFLPISSTGHMILAARIMGMEETEFLKTFEISIQLSTVLAIVLMYRGKLLAGLKLYYKLFWAFIPVSVVGFLFYDFIKGILFNTIVVSVMLILGGIILIWIDRWTRERETKFENLEDISIKKALLIGVAQCFALIPGTSRAAATIIGGVGIGYNERQATEFSFLLAIPTMAAATGYDLFKTASGISMDQFVLLGMGSVFAFIFAWIAVKGFLKIVDHYGFRHFGYYRIGLAVVFLILTYCLGIPLFENTKP